MSEYVKLADHPAFWHVEDGKRTLVYSLNEHGILPVRVVTQDELDNIPFAVTGRDEEE
jgi:hypothetical protein